MRCAAFSNMGSTPCIHRARAEGRFHPEGSGGLPEKDNLCGHKGQTAVHRDKFCGHSNKGEGALTFGLTSHIADGSGFFQKSAKHQHIIQLFLRYLGVYWHINYPLSRLNRREKPRHTHAVLIQNATGQKERNGVRRKPGGDLGVTARSRHNPVILTM